MDDLIYMYAVSSIFKYSTLSSRQLIDSVENLQSLFSMHPEELEAILGRGGAIKEAFADERILEESRREIEWALSKGVKVLSIRDTHYPPLLRECADAPVILFYIGSADLSKVNMVSIVGTRMASAYGRESAARVVQNIAKYSGFPSNRGFAIVSGLAYGVDIAAHKCALEVGLDTIAVLPCGIDLIYPSGHREIAKKMVRQGGVLTEFPHGAGVRRWQFIKRNRIIAGLSSATIVAETRIKGGAMSTIEFANSYGRDIYAVPGRITDSNSYGCNYLISKNVAQIYTEESAANICSAEYGINGEFGGELNLFSFDNANKEKILLSLKANLILDTNSICALAGISFEEASALLLEMELEGSVSVVPGGGYKIRNREK